MPVAEVVITIAELDAKIEALQAKHRDLKRERDRVEREIKAVRGDLYPLVSLKRAHVAEQ